MRTAALFAAELPGISKAVGPDGSPSLLPKGNFSLTGM